MTDDRFQSFPLMADKILQQLRAVLRIDISFIPLRQQMTDDMLDNFPLMADKILQQLRAVFQNPHFIYTFATVYD